MKNRPAIKSGKKQGFESGLLKSRQDAEQEAVFIGLNAQRSLSLTRHSNQGELSQQFL
jgi:hypothetical protein